MVAAVTMGMVVEIDDEDVIPGVPSSRNGKRDFLRATAIYALLAPAHLQRYAAHVSYTRTWQVHGNSDSNRSLQYPHQCNVACMKVPNLELMPFCRANDDNCPNAC